MAVRIRKSDLVFGVAAVVLGGANIHANGLSLVTMAQGALLVATAATLVGLQVVQDKKNLDHRQRGVASGLLQLLTAWLPALAYAWIAYTGYLANTVTSADAYGSARKDFILAAGLVGGVLSLFRSSGTSAAVQATLDRSHMLEQKLETLERGISGVEVGLEAQFALTPREIGDIADRMMKLIVPMREAPLMNAVTLWIRDDEKEGWRILGGFGVSEATARNFRQEILSEERDGAGFVANLAAAGDRWLAVRNRPAEHRWYAKDAGSKRRADTGAFACVMLFDRARRPFGALCLTGERDGAYPDPDLEPAAFARFKNGLYLWAGSFTLLVERYFELDRPEPTS
jgi:hypothetical protein